MKKMCSCLIAMILVSGCALPVTRSLKSTTGEHVINTWGDDESRATIVGKEMAGIYDEKFQVVLGMTGKEVEVIMGKPAKIIKNDDAENWIYYIKGGWGSDIRWVIPPYIPVGRTHYMLVFKQGRLSEILLKTMEYL